MKQTKQYLSEKNIIFIFGSARSGTTWLQLLISEHPNVATTVELPIFNNYIKPLAKAWNREIKLIKNKSNKKILNRGGMTLVWSKEKFIAFLSKFLVDAHQSVLVKNKVAKIVVNKDPHNAFQLEVLSKILPEAKMIHMIRDGRDVVCSKIAAKRNMNFGEGEIVYAAKSWKYYTQHAFTGKILTKNNYLEVRFEDLLKNGPATLKKVYKFCSLEATDNFIYKVLNDNSFEILQKEQKTADPKYKTPRKFYRKGQAGSWKTDMTAIDKIIFHWIADDLLFKLGYEKDQNWYKKPFLLYFLFIPMALLVYYYQTIKLGILLWIKKFGSSISVPTYSIDPAYTIDS